MLAPCLTVKSHPDWSLVNFTDTVVWQLANHGGLNRIWFPLNYWHGSRTEVTDVARAKGGEGRDGNDRGC